MAQSRELGKTTKTKKRGYSPPIYWYANNKLVVVPYHTYIYTYPQKYTKEGKICKKTLANVKFTGVDIKGKNANRPRSGYKNSECKVLPLLKRVWVFKGKILSEQGSFYFI